MWVQFYADGKETIFRIKYERVRHDDAFSVTFKNLKNVKLVVKET